ncbi:sugar phosphate isomerase/epimerase family protein [Microbacterium sp. gxy059]|uniref:sugar phosphate isomerase/epimerase family protein n=1 Tax=Microbacterium sp. gxy059 TaxID=2957199 RepID=UPI003D969E90
MTHHHHPTVSAKPMSRRNLLKTIAASSVAVGAGALLAHTGAAAAAAAAAPATPSPLTAGTRLVPTNRVGIQMFTVRDKVASEGFRAVLEELADIGYSEIEFAGYTQGDVGPITVPELRGLLDDNGLRAVGSHVTLTPDNIDAQIADATALGMPFLGQGGPIAQGTAKADWQRAAQTWNEMGQKAKAAGLTLYIHNHAGEFAYASDDPKTRIYDVLWNELDPSLVVFELDVYWAYVGQHLHGGFEPIDYVTADPRRFPMLHLKDGRLNPDSDNGLDIIEFGAGDIPYQSFLAQLKRDRGQRFGLYEQDNASNVAEPPHPANSLGNARRSYAQIAALRG